MSTKAIITAIIVLIITALSVGMVTAQTTPESPTTTFTVNSSGDLGDDSPGNNICHTTAGTCTLRAALEEADWHAGADTINFNNDYIIIPASAYPPLTDGNTTIYGGNRDIIIMGTHASLPNTAPAFEIASSGNKIQGLNILAFDGGGIIINGGDNNVIGTDGDGVNDTLEGNEISGSGFASSVYAIRISSGASNRISGNTIGIVGGSNYGGIDIYSGGSNLVGTDGNGTSDTTERNVISGNQAHGIWLQSGGNTVAGNYIGVNDAGDTAFGNWEDGIRISNGADANIIGTNGDGVGDSIEGNVISGNGKESYLGNNDGIHIEAGSDSTVIAGNLIGTNAFGTAAIPNEWNGVQSVLGTDATRVGTDGNGVSDGAEGNLISGNGANGLELKGTNGIIAGNKVGTDIYGLAAIPNGRDGVLIEGKDTRIGTDGDGSGDTAERNLISGNEWGGIYVGSADFISDTHTIAGNYIGTNVSGNIALANGFSGITLNNISYSTIGGSLPGTGNLISGNHVGGIVLSNLSFYINIQGNYIGTNVAGDAPLPNEQWGISLGNSYVSSIGGEARNLISCNGSHGIILTGDIYPQYYNDIMGNYIGVLADRETPCGNGGHGIFFDSATAEHNDIGGTISGDRNTIAYNAGDGIAVSDAGATENEIRGNNIFNNGELGIDLWQTENDEVTPNDRGDADTGPNLLQNFPVLQSYILDGANLNVTGALSSIASTQFNIDIFVSKTCDPSGYGEGEIYKKSINVTTGATGSVQFNTDLTKVPITTGYLTATATDPDGNTSEFSKCLQYRFWVYLPLMMR